MRSNRFRLLKGVYSTFKRTFTLPETIAVADIKATYEAGILTLTLPKAEPQKTVQTIDIQ